MSFKLDHISPFVKSYIRSYVSTVSGSSIVFQDTDSNEEDYITINGSSFNAENADFIFGTVIPGVDEADHAVFGSSNGERKITTMNEFYLKKGTYLSFSCVCGEAYGGTIELPEDPDGNEDLVIELLSLERESYTVIPGRITSQNSSTSNYTEFRFPMTEPDGSYYITIKQTDHSGDGYDYYAIKNLRINMLSTIHDSENKITMF